METSPVIPDKIIQQFKEEFKEIDETLPKVIKPEVCDVLISTKLSQNPWSSDENRYKKMNQILNKEKQNTELVVSFQKTFYDINNREPLESEIYDNLKDKIDVTIISNAIETIKKNKDNTIIGSNSLTGDNMV
jgi:hypothetical protein